MAEQTHDLNACILVNDKWYQIGVPGQTKTRFGFS